MKTSQPAAAHSPPFGAPSWLLLGAEPLRAVCEFAGAQFMNKARLPQGDGHPVVLFPGLASDARAMRPLRDMCRGLGYTAHDWGRGWNTGPAGDIDEWLSALADDIATLTRAHHQRVSLIGWSLGGIYAREVAKKLGAARTRQVITLGTPFTGNVEHTRAGFLYRVLNGGHPPIDAAMARRLGTPPDVPTTSIYSRSDGVVAWQACLQGSHHAHTENVEVSGSHSGLVWNAHVLAVVAERLSRAEKAWRPYKAASVPARMAAA